MFIKKCNLKLSFMIGFLFTSVFCFSETIGLASFSIYNDNGEYSEEKYDFGNYLHKELEKNFDPHILSFEYCSQEEFGKIQSIIDVEKLCFVTDNKYCIYGYIQYYDNYVIGSAKLYEYNSRKIIKEFYCADSVVNEDRLYLNFSNNIIKDLTVLFDYKTIADSKFDNQNEVISLSIPVSAGYWNPVGKWDSVIDGIFSISTGLDVTVGTKKKIYNRYYFDFAFVPQISYSLAIGSSQSYPSVYNCISFDIPLLIKFHFPTANIIELGIGPSYGFEIAKIQDNYSDPEIYFQNMFGGELLLGYEISVTKNVVLFWNVIGKIHFSNDEYYDVRTNLGTKIKVLGK